MYTNEKIYIPIIPGCPSYLAAIKICNENFADDSDLIILSYDVGSGSEIMPCIKMDKPLLVYRLLGNVMK